MPSRTANQRVGRRLAPLAAGVRANRELSRSTQLRAATPAPVSAEPSTPPRALDEASVYRARQEGSLARIRKRFTLIDLFAGAGGLSLGFTEAFGHTFRPIWANDFDEDATKTYRANLGGHCHHGDIVALLDDPAVRIPTADVVAGGPPCQGFSLLNKGRKRDRRKQLWRPFLEVVDRAGALVFVMENVPQLLGSTEHAEIVEEASRLGFGLAWAKLAACDYGVAQARQRAFILGCRFADPATVFPPRKTNFNPINGYAVTTSRALDYLPGARPWRTVRDAIADLPRPTGTEVRDTPGPLDLHFGRTPTRESLERYRVIPKEGMNRFDLQRRRPDLTPRCWIRKTSGGTDLFGRLWWDRPSVTIRTEFFKPEKGRYLHPVQHRPITHREAARFQSFPDSFKFSGGKIAIAKQIGNAVPPLLAARVADCVLALLLARDR
jgi:DNA (cytosine-5)-methyltransferase 1